MIVRILTATFVCSLLGLAALYVSDARDPAATIAAGLTGERWYRLTLNDQHLGFWRTVTRRDARGDWVFESEQRFALTAEEPVSTVTRRRFSRTRPHRLLAADHVRSRGATATSVRVVAAGDGYLAIREPEIGAADVEPLELAYTLGDYLEFEQWLAAQRPAPGSSRTVTALDFDRLGPVRRTFDVVDRSETGYLIENAAPLAATQIQLDGRYAPETIRIAGLFDLTRAARADALAPRSTLQSAAFFIPTDRRLPDHQRIARLVLAIQGLDAPRRLFDRARRSGGDWQLTLTADPVSGTRVGAEHLSPTLDFPTRHPTMARLAAEAIQGVEGELAQARALTHFVHGFLHYQPDTPSRGVLQLLNDPRGDCTEFADLLTTLARTVGLPTRTVFGLAYSDSDGPAFAYHAWNELFVDGAWLAMDPTWNQDRVDATHIILPPDGAAALLVNGVQDLSFSVREVEHFAD